MYLDFWHPNAQPVIPGLLKTVERGGEGEWGLSSSFLNRSDRLGYHRLIDSRPLVSTVSPCLTELSVPPPGQWLDGGLRPVAAQT